MSTVEGRPVQNEVCAGTAIDCRASVSISVSDLRDKYLYRSSDGSEGFVGRCGERQCRHEIPECVIGFCSRDS
jgi:hypothetical protein